MQNPLAELAERLLTDRRTPEQKRRDEIMFKLKLIGLGLALGTVFGFALYGVYSVCRAIWG